MVIVHMGSPEDGIPGIENTALSDAEVLSDPDCDLYRSFGLKKGSLWQLSKPKVWLRGFAAVRSGHGVGSLAGDGLQLPGMFLVRDGKVVSEHYGSHAADHGSALNLSENR